MTCIFNSSKNHNVLSIKDLDIIPRIGEDVLFTSDNDVEIEAEVISVLHDLDGNHIEITINY